jgi:hypothetical protein
MRDGVVRKGRLALAAVACVVGLLACAADKPKPTPLETYTPKLAGTQAWAANVGSVNYPLVPSVVKGVLYVASGDGEVQALAVPCCGARVSTAPLLRAWAATGALSASSHAATKS